jgi:hypothetical protein
MDIGIADQAKAAEEAPRSDSHDSPSEAGEVRTSSERRTDLEMMLNGRAGQEEDNKTTSEGDIDGGGEKMQRGVRQMAAITQVWSRTSLGIVYAT